MGIQKDSCAYKRDTKYKRPKQVPTAKLRNRYSRYTALSTASVVSLKGVSASTPTSEMAADARIDRMSAAITPVLRNCPSSDSTYFSRTFEDLQLCFFDNSVVVAITTGDEQFACQALAATELSECLSAHNCPCSIGSFNPGPCKFFLASSLLLDTAEVQAAKKDLDFTI